MSTDFNDMIVFAHVVREGSFTAAAKVLDLPKSTVSRKISALEDRLGVRLLQRTTRSLSLTEPGRVYHEHCERILAEVEAAERAVGSLRDEPRGRLRVTGALRMHFMGSLFAELLVRHPDLEVELLCTDRNVSLVDEGFDVAIRAGQLEDSTLVARRLGHADQVMVASPAYVHRRGEPSHPRELRDHAGLVFGGGDPKAGGATWTLVLGDACEPGNPRPRLRANDFDVLLASALAGQGIAVLPEVMVEQELAQGRLVQVLPQWELAQVPLQVVYPSAQLLSPNVTALVELLVERVATRRTRTRRRDSPER